MTSRSLADTERMAADWLWELRPPADGGATVVGLYGELGSGKTTFVQAVGRALGITEPLQSPTFVLIKNYPVSVRGWQNLIHIDCYRLERASELAALGWADLIANPGNLVLVEWADKVESILPHPHPRVDFEVIDETSRDINFSTG